MGIFGNTGTGDAAAAYWSATAEYIVGPYYAIEENGIAKKISAYLSRWDADSDKVKVALYKHSDMSLVAWGEETKSFAGGFEWITVNLNTNPTLISGTEYVIAVWCDYTASNIRIGYIAAGGTDKGHQKQLAYDSFPDPLTDYIHSTRNFCVYCTYGKLYTQEVSEILGMADSVPTKASFKQAVSEVLGMADSVPTKASFKQAVSEVLGMVDSVARSRVVPITVSDILGLRDSIEKRKKVSKAPDLPDHTIEGGASYE